MPNPSAGIAAGGWVTNLVMGIFVAALGFLALQIIINTGRLTKLESQMDWMLTINRDMEERMRALEKDQILRDRSINK